jgi:hypothetical protein
MNRYEEYIAQLKEENRYLRQEMYLEKPGSRIYTANQREIKANMEEISITQALMQSDITLLEKAL